jgi:ribosomal protein S12 methylthiotransferase
MRKRMVEERQMPITEKNMDRFVNQDLDVLLEERIEGPDNDTLWLGRLYCQAPDVDGAAVISGSGDALKAGGMIRGTVIARRGFDLEVRVRRAEPVQG